MLNEQAVLFELSCKQQPQQTASNMTLAEYSKYWFENIAPNKLASSTVAREKSDIDRFLPHIGHYKLTELRPEHFRKLYVALRKEKNMINGNRYVYFSPEMGTLLKEYRRYCETEALHYEGRIITDNDFLFRKHELDEPMTPTTFTWRFKLILKKNNLPYNLNVHSLRHTNASLLIANGTDVATVSSLLGHAQVSTTLDIYTHAFDKNKKAASDKLHNALEI